MKIRNFVTVLIALFGAGALTAMAGEQPEGYVSDARGEVVRDSYGDCWRTGYWTPAMAIYECDPDLLPKPEKKAEASAPAPLPAPVPAPSEEPIKVTVSADELFDFNKAVLKPVGKQALDGLVSLLSGLKYDEIVAIGYADRLEHNNVKLSLLRAEAVKSYLVEQKSIDADRIFTDGKGKANPVTGDTCKGNKKTKALIACLAPDRRVEVEVHGTRDGDTSSVSERQSNLIPILFATNRKKSGNNEPEAYFLDQEADEETGNPLTLGRALVRVPFKHTRGVVERPGWFRITLEKVTVPMFEAAGVEPFKAADPRKHFTFAGPIEELTDEAFRQDLKKLLATSESRSAFVFVHGYANSFAEATYRTAQIAFDLSLEKYDVIPLMFSWPSNPNYINYIGAKDRVWSAGQQLAEFLNKIIAITDIGVVHIIAHSMGAEVLSEAFQKLGKSNLMAMGHDGFPVPKFNQIILAAPDIRVRDFKKIILPAIESGHRVTNYASSNDTAMRISKKANAEPRAGDSGKGLVLVKGVETIDASAVNNKALGHSFFAESPRMIHDLSLLMSTGAKPEARGLKPIRRKAFTYWLMSPY